MQTEGSFLLVLSQFLSDRLTEMNETTTVFNSGSMYSSGDEDQLANEGLRLSRSTRWRERSRRHVSFEPAMFLFFVAIGLSEIELTHQIIYQTCRVQGYESSDCLLVGKDASSPGVQEIEAHIQPAAASVTLAIIFIRTLIPAFGALLLGAWSDRHGRKPMVLIAGCGLLLTYVSMTGLNFLSMFVRVDPWYYVLTYIPFSIPGGAAVLGATVFAFVTDVTNDENRTIKMGLMRASMLAGALLGTYSSEFILQWTSPTTIFILATICIILGLTYIALFVEDSMIPNADNELGASLSNLFSVGLVRDIVQSVRRKRSRYLWIILGLVICCAATVKLAGGSGIVAYASAHRRFEWSRKLFLHFQQMDSLLLIFANVVGICFLKRVLDWPDTLIALVSIINCIVCATIQGLAVEGWHLYLASGLTSLKGVEVVALLSVGAYLLPSSDIAKFYAVLLSLVGLMPLISEPMFSAFYEATLTNGPGLFHFLAAGIFGVAAVLLIIMQWLLNKRNQPELLL
ncbi:proton-coupled folate transporter-like [Uranotaenia lowii]|uniref:proton-coupled folate transporter-like n=1 Tax=Uranotaenia lowii TaxID=190385 RepID=UPI002478C315|nr:proton-coupled folate transporter-like [Uranotaenia lowii]